MLPKAEYQGLDNDVLGQILRTFNNPALRRADGDVFGRIYEYFLTQFADQKAHDGGEFFTPVALVQTIEPDHGRVLDPACRDELVANHWSVSSGRYVEVEPEEYENFADAMRDPITRNFEAPALQWNGIP